MISNGRICSSTSVKVFPSPAGKNCLPYLNRSRAVCEREIFLPQKFSKPEAHPENHSQARSWKNKLWPIDVFHLHLSDKTRILRSNLSTKYLYICQRVLFNEWANCLHIAYLCKVWTARWSMVLILVIQWKKTTCELVYFDPSTSSPSPSCSSSQLVNLHFPPQMHPASQPVNTTNCKTLSFQLNVHILERATLSRRACQIKKSGPRILLQKKYNSVTDFELSNLVIRTEMWRGL